MQPDEVPLPPPGVDGAAARAAVEEVLARPEYADLEPGLLDRAWDAVGRAVGALLEALTGTAAGTAIGYLVLAALAAGVVVLAVRATRSVRRDAVAPGLATAGDVGRSPARWRADADEHEAAGRWRDGVRCRYRALVADLAAAGVVEEVPGRTAGEYLAAVRAGAPAAAEPFGSATALFERAWYGREDVGAAERDALVGAAEEAVAAAAASRTGART